MLGRQGYRNRLLCLLGSTKLPSLAMIPVEYSGLPEFLNHHCCILDGKFTNAQSPNREPRAIN